MLGWLIRKTEIRSREGVLHFQRWRILETRWFNLYLHHICESDGDPHPHDHPWDFCSFVLKGNAVENLTDSKANNPGSVWLTYWTDIYVLSRFTFYRRLAEQFHKLTIVRPLWTLVVTGPRRREWGYLVGGKWVQHQEYRKLKHNVNISGSRAGTQTV